MKIVTVLKVDPGYPEESDGNTTVEFHCKLFSDSVIGHLCMRGSQELNLKGEFICEGCFMDCIME